MELQHWISTACLSINLSGIQPLYWLVTPLSLSELADEFWSTTLSMGESHNSVLEFLMDEVYVFMLLAQTPHRKSSLEQFLILLFHSKSSDIRWRMILNPHIWECKSYYVLNGMDNSSKYLHIGKWLIQLSNQHQKLIKCAKG